MLCFEGIQGFPCCFSQVCITYKPDTCALFSIRVCLPLTSMDLFVFLSPLRVSYLVLSVPDGVP